MHPGVWNAGLQQLEGRTLALMASQDSKPTYEVRFIGLAQTLSRSWQRQMPVKCRNRAAEYIAL